VKIAPLAAVFVFTLAAGPAFAQTDGRFAIGLDFSVRAAPDGDARGHKGVGVLWRFGHGRSGWGWHWGLGWYEADLDLPIADRTVEFGEIHIRPAMAGYGYTYRAGRTSITADVLAGVALVSLNMAPAANDFYRQRLGANDLSTPASVTVTTKPEVGVWYDVSDKIGLHISGSYVVARPQITIESSLGEDRRRIRADLMQLRVGLAYSVF